MSSNTRLNATVTENLLSSLSRDSFHFLAFALFLLHSTTIVTTNSREKKAEEKTVDGKKAEGKNGKIIT